jgi:hypothetical protein
MTMRKRTSRVQMALAAFAMAASCASWAQQTPSAAPAPRESPRPEQLEPGVNTSAPADNSSALEGIPRSASDATRDNSSAPASTPSAAPAPEKPAPREAGASSATRSKNSPREPSAPAAQTAAAVGPVAPKSGAAGKAQDRIELDTTQITGNRELPKVLYIVPWKRSDLGDLVGKPVNSLLDEVLTPIDRDVFKRENRYYEALKPDQAGGGAAGAASPGGSGEKH